MKIGAALCLAIILLFPALGSAEFYRYRDENGVTRFTDNLQEVPEDQRPKLHRYREADDDLTPKQREEKAKARAAAEAQARKAEKEKRGKDRILNVRIDSPEDLQRIKTELDDQYEFLMKRKKTIESERDRLTTPEEVRAWQGKVSSLNGEIRKFEEQRRLFVKKAAEFNALQKSK